MYTILTKKPPKNTFLSTRLSGSPASSNAPTTASNYYMKISFIRPKFHCHRGFTMSMLLQLISPAEIFIRHQFTVALTGHCREHEWCTHRRLLIAFIDDILISPMTLNFLGPRRDAHYCYITAALNTRSAQLSPTSMLLPPLTLSAEKSTSDRKWPDTYFISEISLLITSSWFVISWQRYCLVKYFFRALILSFRPRFRYRITYRRCCAKRHQFQFKFLHVHWLMNTLADW
jgi:hypothetical protein